MNEPLLSVVMPVFNSEKRLCLSIESILGQKYANIELILVDDGSSDASSSICDRYANQDGRVKVVHQKNAGVSTARNRGVVEAKGEYITFVDSDDTIDPETYKSAFTIFYRQPADIIIFGMSFDYYRGETLTHSRVFSIEVDLDMCLDDADQYFFDLYERNYLSSVCNKIVRTSIIKDNAISFETNMAILEDLKYVLDLFEYAKRVYALHNVFYHYYNDGSPSVTRRRHDFDYLRNFQILDGRLRRFAADAGLDFGRNGGRINALILRYYLIAFEMLFAKKLDWNRKYTLLKEYVGEPGVRAAVDNALCYGKRLKVMHYLLSRNHVITLFAVLWLNVRMKRAKQLLERYRLG